MNPARLLLLVTFVLYGTQNANSFKLLKKLLAKHLQSADERPEESPSIAVEQAYGPTVPHEIETYEGGSEGRSTAEWNGQVADSPVMTEIRNDGTAGVDGARSDDASSEEEYDEHKTDEKRPEAAANDGEDNEETDDGTSIKDRLRDKMQLVKSAIRSVKEKMKSIKEMTKGGGAGAGAGDGYDDGTRQSGFLYEGDDCNGGTTVTSSTPVTTTDGPPPPPPPPLPPVVTTGKPADRDCTTDAYGRVVVKCHNEPIVVIGSPEPQPPPRKAAYYYYYYYPSPTYGHQPWPVDKQQQIDCYRTNAMRYATNAPWTVHENVPYINTAYPYGRVPGVVGQWAGRYGYDNSKNNPQYFLKPVPYRYDYNYYDNDNGNYYSDSVPPHTTGQQQIAPAMTYATPASAAVAAKPIVANADYGTPTPNDGSRFLHVAAAAAPLPADQHDTGDSGLSYGEYAPPFRGDIPLQRDDSPRASFAGGQLQKDVYETVPKERRHVDNSPAPVPASSETPSDAPRQQTVTEAAAVPSEKTPVSSPR